MEKEIKLAVIGLGYVGLPLAVAFSKVLKVVGFDVNKARVNQLESGVDSTLEVTPEELQHAQALTFSSSAEAMADCNVYIVTVPTPIDEHNQPDLVPMKRASETIANLLQPGDIVIYESTVYPGATEEVCVPILESLSGLTFNQDFFVGYSPERINPGDKEHRLQTIVKVVAGSTPEITDTIAELYGRVVEAGVHKSSSIKAAEAAKVIENTQRDVNIALINELAMIFGLMGIDTQEVLEAAGTKWNFLPFRPGLVGGHCIGVDPFYLTHKAQSLGYHPEMILAGRRINDNMGRYVVGEIIKIMIRRGLAVQRAKVLILGLAFKENCPDVRNTKVVSLVEEFESFGTDVTVADSWVDAREAEHEYGIRVCQTPEKGQYDVVLLAVPHKEFVAAGAGKLREYGNKEHIFYDLKSVFAIDQSDARL